LETACIWLQTCLRSLPPKRPFEALPSPVPLQILAGGSTSSAASSSATTAPSPATVAPLATVELTGLGALISLVVGGCGHPEIEIAKLCHDSALLAAHGAVSLRLPAAVSSTGASTSTSSSIDPFTITLEAVLAQKNHPSFHVRETVMLCASVLMINNWMQVSAAHTDTILY
jgi:hypothetical protein